MTLTKFLHIFTWPRAFSQIFYFLFKSSKFQKLKQNNLKNFVKQKVSFQQVVQWILHRRVHFVKPGVAVGPHPPALPADLRGQPTCIWWQPVVGGELVFADEPSPDQVVVLDAFAQEVGCSDERVNVAHGEVTADKSPDHVVSVLE